MEQLVRGLVERGSIVDVEDFSLDDSFIIHLKSRMHRDLSEGSIINISNFLYNRIDDISIIKEFIEMFPSLLVPLSLTFLRKMKLDSNLLEYFISLHYLSSPNLSPSCLRRHFLFLMRNHTSPLSLKLWSSFFKSLHSLSIYESYNIVNECLIEFGAPYLLGIFELFPLWKAKDPTIDCSDLIGLIPYEDSTLPFHLIGLIASSLFTEKEKMALLKGCHVFDKWSYLVFIDQLDHLKPFENHQLIEEEEEEEEFIVEDITTSQYMMYLITFKNQKCTFPYRGNEEAIAFCLKAQILRFSDWQKLLELIKLANEKPSLLEAIISFLTPLLSKISFILFNDILTCLLKFKEKIVFDFLWEMLRTSCNLKYLLPKIADNMNYHYFPLIKEFLPILARRCPLSFSLVIRFLVEDGRKSVLDFAFPFINSFLKNNLPLSSESESLCLIIDSVSVLVKSLYLKGDLALLLFKDLPQTPPIIKRIIYFYRFYPIKEIFTWKDKYPLEVLDSLSYYPLEDGVREELYEMYLTALKSNSPINPISLAHVITNEVSLMPRSMIIGSATSYALETNTPETPLTTLIQSQRPPPIGSIFEAISIFKDANPPLLPLEMLLNLPSLTLVPWIVKIIFLQSLSSYSKLYIHIDYSSLLKDLLSSTSYKTMKPSQQSHLILILSLFKKNFSLPKELEDDIFEIISTIKQGTSHLQRNDEIQSSLILFQHLMGENGFGENVKLFSFSWILLCLYFPNEAEDHWCKEGLSFFRDGVYNIPIPSLLESLRNDLKEPYPLQGISSFFKGITDDDANIDDFLSLIEGIKERGNLGKKVDIFYRIAGMLNLGCNGGGGGVLRSNFDVQSITESINGTLDLIEDSKLKNLFSLLKMEQQKQKMKKTNTTSTRFGSLSILSFLLEREKWDILTLVPKLPLNLPFSSSSSSSKKAASLSFCLKHYRVEFWNNEHINISLLREAIAALSEQNFKDQNIDFFSWKRIGNDLLREGLMSEHDKFQNLALKHGCFAEDFFDKIEQTNIPPFKVDISLYSPLEVPKFWKSLPSIESPPHFCSHIKDLLRLKNIDERIRYAINNGLSLNLFTNHELLSSSASISQLSNQGLGKHFKIKYEPFIAFIRDSNF